MRKKERKQINIQIRKKWKENGTKRNNWNKHTAKRRIWRRNRKGIERKQHEIKKKG